MPKSVSKLCCDVVSRRCTAHESTHDVKIPGFNNENETKNTKKTGLMILVLSALCLSQKTSLFDNTCPSSISISLVNHLNSKCDIRL